MLSFVHSLCVYGNSPFRMYFLSDPFIPLTTHETINNWVFNGNRRNECCFASNIFVISVVRSCISESSSHSPCPAAARSGTGRVRSGRLTSSESREHMPNRIRSHKNSLTTFPSAQNCRNKINTDIKLAQMYGRHCKREAPEHVSSLLPVALSIRSVALHCLHHASTCSDEFRIMTMVHKHS